MTHDRKQTAISGLGQALKAWAPLASDGDPLARAIVRTLHALEIAAKRNDAGALVAKLGPDRWAKNYLRKAGVDLRSPAIAPEPSDAIAVLVAFCSDALRELGNDDGLVNVRLRRHARRIARDAATFRDDLIASGVKLPKADGASVAAGVEAELVTLAQRLKIDARSMASAVLRGFGMPKHARDSALKSKI